MKRYSGVASAKFCREPFTMLEITIRGLSAVIPLWHAQIEYCARDLSEKEIEESIAILSQHKVVMLKERNFPPIYEDMLSDLIKAQKERYGVKKEGGRALGYSVSIDKLEEILGDHYKLKDAHIFSIDVGENRSKAERIDLRSDYSYLVMSFREENRDDR